MATMLVVAGKMVQAQNSTHQSINRVLEQNTGVEPSLQYQMPEDEDVPAMMTSGLTLKAMWILAANLHISTKTQRLNC